MPSSKKSRLLLAAAKRISDRRRREPRSAGKTLANFFGQIAQSASKALGSSWAFLIALAIVVGWAMSGPLFGYSDTWQLVINTGTTIVTFLMVFLIQNAQNRDAKALHLKLDELIHSIHGARNKLIDLENCTDAQLHELEGEFARLASGRTSRAESNGNR